MPHAVSLISTLAAGFALALVFGYVARRLGLPALIGYLVAGVVIGPATPGFVADADIASQLAEIGVMLLMFGVGLHFSLDDLLAVRKLALPGAVVQMGVATALGVGTAMYWGWPFGAALVFGLALSVASTVVLLKALEERGTLESGDGRIAVGWLVVEDLAMVLVLVVLPPLAGALGGRAPEGAGGPLWTTLAMTLAEVAAFIVLMLVVGRRLFPWVLWQVTKTGSRELFTLAVIVAAVSIAYGSALLFGVSFALGAFFAGMVLRESEFSHRAAEETLPLRDAFAVLFFVSVGMLFRPAVLVDEPLQVLGVVTIIVIGKSIAAAALVLGFGYAPRTALTVAASLAQIGEFSFILAALGASLGLLSAEAQSLIVAGALISIAVNPLLFRLVDPVCRALAARRPSRRRASRPGDPLAELPVSTEARFLSRQVVLVGHGRVGRRIAAALGDAGIALVVVEENREAVEQLRARGVAAVFGNATDAAVLIQAHVATARLLVVATPQTIEVRKMAAVARTLNPTIAIAVRSHNAEEAALLESERTAHVFVGESELAAAMVAHVLRTVDAGSDAGKASTPA